MLGVRIPLDAQRHCWTQNPRAPLEPGKARPAIGATSVAALVAEQGLTGLAQRIMRQATNLLDGGSNPSAGTLHDFA